MKLFLYENVGQRRRMVAVAAGILALVAAVTSARADLSLETETARLLEPGKFEFSTALELQHSKDGEELAVPMSFEVGVLKRLELLIEPVVFTSIIPSSSADPQANGIGDLEATLTFLVLEEKGWLPAAAVAGEIKIPTARNTNIGTGETDYTGYFILSKRIGKLDISGNFAYTVLGKPKGVTLQNIYSWAVSLDYKLTDKFDLLAEVLGNTPSGAKDNSNVTTEATGGEIVGTGGVRYHLRSNVDLFGAVSYDNAQAVSFRSGVTFKF